MVPEKKSYMDLDLRRNADYWNIPISLPEVLKASKVEDEGALLHLASSDGVKSKLRTNTDEALSQGCFGAPWMHVRSEGRVEPFFGSDRLPLIGHLIGHQYEGPLNHLATSTPV
ncbi:unnamed protein product [Nippostrongylus brasiliensis]|uniref:Glutathione s-transferase kappa 2 (inferred by orthology to a C. elegans protein) n=1 Tax=Nippostrongylus brasiliensis TaxID=27835 RepID=A0A0N4Y6L1_NIPBR|nr:unnamed protein product [Nippostrongylus brasiliensis]